MDLPTKNFLDLEKVRCSGVTKRGRSMTDLAEHNLIPKRMCYLAGGVEPLELRVHRFLEDLTLEAGDVASGHSSLIYTVQDPGNGGEKIGPKKLGILKEAKRVASEVSNTSANGNRAELTDALYTHQLVDTSW
jgi:hypothetical protein